MPGNVRHLLFVKDYYSILRVSRSADIQTIKRAYRALVQKYHPDINPDPRAAELIKEINEAYEVLRDSVKKSNYDFQATRSTAPAGVSQPAPHRDPRYRKSYGPLKSGNYQLELIKNYVHLAVKVCRAGCFICLFLLLDFCLPHRIVKDTVQGLYTNTSGRTSNNIIVSQSGQRIKIGFEDLRTMERGETIEITEAAITSIAIGIYVPKKSHHIINMATLYRTYLFVPVLLLITSVLGLLIRNQVELQFNVGIVSFVLLIFTVILIFK